MTLIFEKVIPELKGIGVSQDVLDTILVENPRRLFEGG
jgi:predicted metal-dependent phosphotriesterase family hydrolase